MNIAKFLRRPILKNIWERLILRRYDLNFLKDCLSQALLALLLNALSHISIKLPVLNNFYVSKTCKVTQRVLNVSDCLELTGFTVFFNYTNLDLL